MAAFIGLVVVGWLALPARVSASEDPPNCSLAHGGAGSVSQGGINFDLPQAHVGDTVPVFASLGKVTNSCKAINVTGTVYIATGLLTNFLVDVTLNPGLLVSCPDNALCQPGPYNLTITPALVGAAVNTPLGGVPGVPKSVRAVENGSGTVQSVFDEQLSDFHSTSIQIVTPCLQIARQFAYPAGQTCFSANEQIRFTGSVSNCGDITLTNVTVRDDRAGAMQLLNPADGSLLLPPFALAPGASAIFSNSFLPTLNEVCVGKSTNTLTATGTDITAIGGPRASVTNRATAICDICALPVMVLTQQCPPTPVVPGGLLVYSGMVSNAGNVTLTNLLVVNNRPTNNTPVLGPISLAPSAALAFTNSYVVPVNSCGPYADTLTARASTACGNLLSNTATVSCAFSDTQPPSIICPANIFTNAAPGANTVTNLALGTPIVFDNCAVMSVTNNAPSVLPVGTNMVVWTAIDSSGLTSTCQQTVIVAASIQPCYVEVGTLPVSTASERAEVFDVATGTLFSFPYYNGGDLTSVYTSQPGVNDTFTWTQTTSFQPARTTYWGRGTADGSHLYFCGTIDGVSMWSSFGGNGLLGGWQTMTPLPTSGCSGYRCPLRSLHQAFIFQARLYVLAGWYGDGLPSYSSCYSAPILSGGLVGSFVQTTSLPLAMAGHSATVSSDGKVYVANGTNLFLAQIATNGSIGSWATQPTIAGMNHNNYGNRAMALVNNLLVIVDSTKTFICQLNGLGQLSSTLATITNPATFNQRSVYANNGNVYVTATTGKIYRIGCLSQPPVSPTNQVLSLNGTTGYVSVPSAPDLQNPSEITVEGWIYPRQGSQNSTIYMNKSDNASAGSSRSYELGWVATADSAGPGTSVRFILFLSNGNWGWVDALAAENTWVHVAGRYSSSQGVLQLFTNGVLAKTITETTGTPLTGTSLRQTTLPVRFGRGDYAPYYYARGYMDEIRIWNKARTPEEIYRDRYCRLTGVETNLTGYWNFDDGTAHDLTGHGHDGTFAGNAQAVPIVGTDDVHAGICGAVAPPRAATASAVVTNGFFIGATITDGGFGYTNAPTVRIVGGGGSGAQAVAVVSNGVVVAINVVNAGSGYTSPPLVIIAPPFIEQPVLGIAAMSLLNFTNLAVGTNYQLQSSFGNSWSNLGGAFTAASSVFTQYVAGAASASNYRLAPTPVPSQAYATAQVVNGFVVGATVTSGGSGYVAIPAVNILGGGGSNATAVANLSGGLVASIGITSAGIGYTSIPTIEIAPPPATALSPTVLPVMRVDSAALAPYQYYQLQFKASMGVPWGNWSGGLFAATAVTNAQPVFITNTTGFFRLQYVP